MNLGCKNTSIFLQFGYYQQKNAHIERFFVILYQRSKMNFALYPQPFN